MHSRHRICALAALLLTACADEDDDDEIVAYGIYDAQVDFSDYQTFDVVLPDDVPAGENMPMGHLESNHRALTQAIVHEMQARGYVLDEVDPDLLINPFVRLQNVEVAVAKPYWYDYYYGWYWGYGYTWYDVDIIEFEAGTLMIDAVDVGDPNDDADDRLVFRGHAVAVLPAEPSDVSERVRDVVEWIFEFWPEESAS